MDIVPFNVIHLESLIHIPIVSHCQHTFATPLGKSVAYGFEYWWVFILG